MNHSNPLNTSRLRLWRGLFVAITLLCLDAALAAPDPVWQNLTSKRGEIPAPPGGSTMQTGAVVGDLDGDGVNDFILSFRQKPPALVWYRRNATGWDQFVIEKEFLSIEAGGAVLDIDGDGTLLDLLLQETKPEFVTFEMDIFWTVHPGQDPAKLLRKYPDRWALMHVKDLRKGTKTGLRTGSEDVRNDVALGTGQIDLPAVLKAAQELGVKHFIIEDESPTVMHQIPQSLRYLESLAW